MIYVNRTSHRGSVRVNPNRLPGPDYPESARTRTAGGRSKLLTIAGPTEILALVKHENPLPISTRSRPAMWALALSLWAGGVGLAVAAPTRTPQEAAVPGLVASAQADAGLARAELDRFKALFKTRRFAQAYEAAATAFSAGGGSEALECVGVSALNLGRIELAHQAYGAILLDAGADAGLRTRAGNQIAALNLQTGQIHLPASPAETNVFLDGAFVTTLPAERTLRALPGRHVVRFEREGEPDREVVVRTAAGRSVRVEAVPAAAEVAAAPAAPVDAVPVAAPAPAVPVAAPAPAASALDRFARAFKAGRMIDAFNAAEEAVLSGSGADALEAKGAAALRLGRIDTAHRAYAAVLAEPGAKPDVRTRAENQLRALDWQTGELVVEGGPAGAQVELDGFPVGRLPLGRTLRALPGEHRIRITGPDVSPFATKVRVTAQRKVSVAVPAGAVAAAPPPVASVATPAPAPVQAQPTAAAAAAANGRPAFSPSQRVVAGPPAQPWRPASRRTPGPDARPAFSERAIASAVQQVVGDWSRPTSGNPWYVKNEALCRWRCPEGAICPENLLNLIAVACRREDARLGLDGPDRDYFWDHGKRFGGAMMRIPEDLIQASLAHPVVNDFKVALDRLGYRYVEFKSTSVPNLPAGFWRILILIETPDYDQWMQIAEYDGPPRTLARNIDFSVVQKRDEQGNVLAQPRFFFSGYSRLPGNDGRWEHEGVGSKFPLNRCVMCHPSGLRGITPVPGSVAEGELASLKYVQDKMEKAPLSSFDGFYDTARRGPIMGLVDPPGRASVLERCASQLSAESRKRVGAAMNCASCHDGKDRGVINAMTEGHTIWHKIVKAPAEARMPPEEPLSAEERLAVAHCLKAEYGEQLRSWLFQVAPAPAGSGKSASNGTHEPAGSRTAAR